MHRRAQSGKSTARNNNANLFHRIKLNGVMLVIGLFKGRWRKRGWLIVPILLVAAVIFMANFQMAADHMFYQPTSLQLTAANKNNVEPDRLVIGITHNGEAKAYPIRFLGYHHQVRDSIGGKPVIVTYCTVCRTGRVFEPLVNGQPENFRLVGMDHFNAMFEDEKTGSWWRQVNGEAITGKLKGQQLPEFLSTQTSLSKWLQLYPESRIMQADSAFINSYDSTYKYESGKSKSSLTGTDSTSWGDKSWVIGIKAGNERRAYDWNELRKERLIQDKAGNSPVMVVMSTDQQSFFAFERPGTNLFTISGDTLIQDNKHYRINGTGIDTTFSLSRISAYQEFWHSWKTFNPGTTRRE
ncbi:MAG: DUF3179 domain-containing protein [Chitinophagaceae bacterium]|nr:DUF3179 domain-containing protein [Chitinophagaceae bacterium]